MDQTHHALEVRLPVTSDSVCNLLGALTTALRGDAARYKKAAKMTDDHHPAVADKLDAAEAIARIRQELRKRSRARWNDYNKRGQS